MVPHSFLLALAVCAQAAALSCTQEQHGFDFPYGDLNMTITATSADCCELCIQTDGCVMYVWTPGDTTGGNLKHCWLKNGKSNPAVARSDRVSGRNPNAPPVPAPTPMPAPTTWSSKYRNWHYYTGGDYSGVVVPPKPIRVLLLPTSATHPSSNSLCGRNRYAAPDRCCCRRRRRRRLRFKLRGRNEGRVPAPTSTCASCHCYVSMVYTLWCMRYCTCASCRCYLSMVRAAPYF
jgi:hypothetical protein